MKLASTSNRDDSLLIDISDALSERDRVRFTVHTRTKLPQFAKQNLSVVRQHEEFIWLHDCLEDNDLYAGYIIPPAPPKPDFEASREKLQRLGDSQASLMKEEFAKMKQELEVEYLGIFKKTVAMHEIFLKRLAAHHKFREDTNFKVFLEYENDLSVRCKSKKERLAGSISSLGKSLTDFVITTSQVASSTTAAGSALLAGSSPRRQQQQQQQQLGKHSAGQSSGNDQAPSNNPNTSDSNELENNQQQQPQQYSSDTQSPSQSVSTNDQKSISNNNNTNGTSDRNNQSPSGSEDASEATHDEEVDEQYFEKERLFLALYYNSIRETAIQADKVVQLQKCCANDYLSIAQQLIKLSSVEVLPITTQTKDTSSFIACQLPSLIMPASAQPGAPGSSKSRFSPHQPNNSQLEVSTSHQLSQDLNDDLLDDTRYDDEPVNRVDFSLPSSSRSAINSAHTSPDNTSRLAARNSASPTTTTTDKSQHQESTAAATTSTAGAISCTSQGLKQMLLHVSDFFEQARKIETRIASDEDLKLTDLFLYYKRDTVAAQDLLMRRLRFMADYETAVKNLDKARLKGRTQMQLAEVIQKHAKKNYVTISKLAKEELINYKQRRVASFRKTFADLVELELKHLKSYSQLISNCLNTCRGISPSVR